MRAVPYITLLTIYCLPSIRCMRLNRSLAADLTNLEARDRYKCVLKFKKNNQISIAQCDLKL